MRNLIPINTIDDIPAKLKQTPIGKLLEYHNLCKSFDEYQLAELIIGTCVDFRINLRLSDNFAFIIRAGGANLRYSDFKVSFIISSWKIKHLALIGHTNCGMVGISSLKNNFIEGLVDGAGCDAVWAEEHFMQFSPDFEIGDEIDFLLTETERLQNQYPKLIIHPLIYRTEDHLLYLIKQTK